MDMNELYDKQTIEVMRRVILKDSNCIDIGCHAGVMLDEIIKLSPNGIHYAFEPLPDFAEKLSNKYNDFDNINVINKALSDVTGDVSFQHVVTNPGYSGLKKRHYDRDNETVNKIQVQTECLDNVIPRNLDIRFIKIDVEGGELQVMYGAVETIRINRPIIVFEHGLGAAEYYGTTPEAVFDFLVDDCGLQCFTMQDWLESNGKRNLARDEFCNQFRGGINYYFLAA